ncbi:unnamed protein product [Rhizoctonia solani]|uniref:Palmitoyltransferase PFA4 n=1 Tax=Rhizoctonia solani TaxID=456999 RepID=A0A8H3E2Y7_9AGAM|nr:unnamed protein product [Rhizoctonia solani]
MGRLIGRIWVGFTLSLISFISYSSQIFIIWPWYGRTLSIPLLKLLVPFNILVGMVFWNYIWTVRTDPGTVPKSWKPDLRSLEGCEVKKLTGAPRYCRTCERYKPPRSHHCRQCKKCVLRMDHHCPWVNNCVGHFNYGHFIRFLFFVDVACSYHFVMISMRAWHAMNASGFWFFCWSEVLGKLFNMPYLINLTSLVTPSLYHFYCLASNQTTIEGWEKDKVATLVRRGKIRDVKFPYHLGIGKNIRAVLGERAWLWCWPQPVRGSGLSFPVADGTDPETQFTWPPKDPNTNLQKDRSRAAATALQERLQGSPWTYGNDSFNPTLRTRGTNNHPPYHPSYQPEGPDSLPIDPDKQFDHEYDSVSTSSSPSRASSGYDIDTSAGRDVRMRRGSEGWEVRPLTNEEIVQRYAQSRGLETGTRSDMELDQDEGEGEGKDEERLDHESAGVPIIAEPKPKYNLYVPEDSDSSEDEALGAHVGTYANE